VYYHVLFDTEDDDAGDPPAIQEEAPTPSIVICLLFHILCKFFIRMNIPQSVGCTSHKYLSLWAVLHTITSVCRLNFIFFLPKEIVWKISPNFNVAFIGNLSQITSSQLTLPVSVLSTTLSWGDDYA
jgi:hypothetical protein